MNSTLEIMQCDVAMPTVNDYFKSMFFENFTMLIVLLAIELVIAAVIVMLVMSRKKDKKNKNDSEYVNKEEGSWEE